VSQILANDPSTAGGRYEDLTESGLSSLDMVNLMLAVEGEFDLKIRTRT